MNITPLGKLSTFEKKKEIPSFNKSLTFIIIPKYNDNISPTLKIQFKKNTKLPNYR